MATIQIPDRPSRDRSITVWRGNVPTPLNPAAPPPPEPPAPAVEAQINQTARISEERKNQERAARQVDGPQFSVEASRQINRVVGKSEQEQLQDALNKAYDDIADLTQQLALKSAVGAIQVITVTSITKHGNVATLVGNATIDGEPVADLQIMLPVGDIMKIVASKRKAK